MIQKDFQGLVMTDRTVYFVSDGTWITAETFGNSILAQFPIKPRHVRRPFIDTAEKAYAVVREINEMGEREGKRAIVFATLVDRAVLKIVLDHCQGRVISCLEGGYELSSLARSAAAHIKVLIGAD